MPLFLDTRGRSTLGIGICARCSQKMSLDDLYMDPNYPGLRVCIDDLDEFDPWRLAAPPTDDITLKFIRPDIKLWPFPSDAVQGEGLYNNGGVLCVSVGGWPTDNSGAAGSLWSNGGVCSIVPGLVPVAAGPIYFNTVLSAAWLLALGGAGIPNVQPVAGSLQLWTSGGEIWIA